MHRPTTFLEVDHPQLRLTLACETFQITGSFKFRAASEVARSVPNELLLTASSGNFGQALACAARRTGKKAIVVMPQTSAQVKIEAVRAQGGQVELVDVTRVSRAERVRQLAEQYPEAYQASAYDDPLVIRGNASLGRELAGRGFDCIVSPVGGGGLISGIVTGLGVGRPRVLGAEPLLANDAARSLREGRLLANEGEPQTLADGARTVSLGRHNWEIVRQGVEDILEVSEEAIGHAVRWLFLKANLKVEPTGALAVAAVLAAPERFADQNVCCVISGGNVDPALYASLLSAGI
ncbi:MAG: serine/threonine dehydratase [Candidatus Xenobia bacterium]